MRTDIRFTYAEYRTLPETGPRYQLIDGDLLMSPAPNVRHQTLVMRLGTALHSCVEAHRFGRVWGGPVDVILSDEDVLQPDLVFVSTARAAIVAEEGLRGAPDLCIEVLSPTTRELDLGAKRVLYARHGVTEYWVVDPETSRVAIYNLQQDAARAARQLSGHDVVTTALLPGFALALPTLFAP